MKKSDLALEKEIIDAFEKGTLESVSPSNADLKK